jgi:hypothetical protein
MLGSLLPPPYGFRLILLDSFAQVIPLGEGQLCLYITVLRFVLEFGNALRISERRDREQKGNGAQQDTPPSSAHRCLCSHAQQLTPEFAAIPYRYR